MTAPARPGLAEVLHAGWRDEWANKPNDLVMDALAAVAEQWFTDRLDSDDVRAIVAERLLKAASPEGLRAHLTPLERERFENHAETLLAAVRAVLGGGR